MTGTAERGLDEVAAHASDVLDEIERAVVGKRPALELILSAILADGHVLIEEYPGLAKTLIARSFATVTGAKFSRVQCTPDLMPSDVTGASIFNQRTSELEFRPGPGARRRQGGRGARARPPPGPTPRTVGATGGRRGRRAGVHELSTGAHDRSRTLTAAKRHRSQTPWTEERIRNELDDFLAGATEWPSYRDFQRAGRQTLGDEVTRSGGARLWAKRLKLPCRERKPGYATRWTEERVRRDLEEFLRGRDRWPSRLEFEAAGRKPLRDALLRLGGPEPWAAEFGLALPNLRFGSRRAWTDERIEAELRTLLDGRQGWPTPREFERSASVGVAAAVVHGRGTAYWARFFGLAPPPRSGLSRQRMWTDERIRAELERFCQGRATWPTEREFLDAGESTLYSAACQYHGARYWADELGLIRKRRHGPAPRIRDGNRRKGVG
jgi:hypothetical protein